MPDETTKPKGNPQIAKTMQRFRKRMAAYKAAGISPVGLEGLPERPKDAENNPQETEPTQEEK